MWATFAEQEWFQQGIAKGREKGIQEGIQEGRQEGRQEGKYEAKLDMARSFLSLGVDKEKISVATGLPVQELEKIQAEL